MNSDCISVGVVGASANSAIGRTHLVAMRMDGLFDVSAGVFGSSAESSRHGGGNWGVDSSRVYGSIDQLLEEEQGRIDVVVVLTPPALHVEHVTAALSAGFNVICEKPATSNSSDTESIAQKADELGKRVFVVQNYVNYPRVLDVMQRLGTGIIGPIQRANVFMPQETFIRLNDEGEFVPPQQWRRNDVAPIPTVSLDLGVHVVNLLRNLVREPIMEASTKVYSVGKLTGIVDHVDCLYRTPSGIGGVLTWGKVSAGISNGLGFDVFGSLGSISWLQQSPNEFVLRSAQGEVQNVIQASKQTLRESSVLLGRFKPGHPEGFIESMANNYIGFAREIRPDLLKQRNLAEAASRVVVQEFRDVIEDFKGLELIHSVAQ